MSILTEQRERRDAQPIPADAAGAAVKFVCNVYRCTMDGAKCRDYHVHAVEFRPENREACIDCPAGLARAKLLGMGGSAFNRAAICQGKTAKGAQCTNVATTGGLCHGCSGNAASRSAAAANARKNGWDEKRKAKGPVRSTAKSAASPKKRPWMVKSGAHGITDAVAPPPCKRDGCDRPTVPGTALAEYCRECVNTAYTAIKKSTGRTPTYGERAAWLAEHPAMVKYRRGVTAAPVVVAPVPERMELPVPDVHVAVSPEAVDAVLEAEAVAAVVEVVTGGAADGDIPTEDATPSDLIGPTGDGMATVTFKINGLAFARLRAMAALGIYGDDPNDVARAAVFGWLHGFVWSEP